MKRCARLSYPRAQETFLRLCRKAAYGYLSKNWKQRSVTAIWLCICLAPRRLVLLHCGALPTYYLNVQSVKQFVQLQDLPCEVPECIVTGALLMCHPLLGPLKVSNLSVMPNQERVWLSHRKHSEREEEGRK
jgi:hypothetical protein